jgi:hypothetical protein
MKPHDQPFGKPHQYFVRAGFSLPVSLVAAGLHAAIATPATNLRPDGFLTQIKGT